MSKCVANLYRYVEVCLSANVKYLDALSCVDDPGPSRKELTELSEPVCRKQRRLSGFNPVQKSTTALFKEVLSGDYIVQGFRNGRYKSLCRSAVFAPLRGISFLVAVMPRGENSRRIRTE
jgi:hypothetical protein